MQAKNGSATATLRTGSGILRGFILQAGTGAVATLTLYDNTSAAGDVLGTLAVVANDSRQIASLQVPFVNGLHAVLAGAGAQFTCYIE